jgi:CRISPR-associated protein Csm1
MVPARHALALAVLLQWVDHATTQRETGDHVPDELRATVQRLAWHLSGRSPSLSPAWPSVSQAALRSVFDRLGALASQSSQAWIVPAPLAVAHIFPIPAGRDASPDSTAVRAALRAAIDTIDPTASTEVRLEAVLFALQRYAWCLPSPLDAVSLYDFARIHAAAAAALDGLEGELFVLGGDLSGVQDFIYTLTADGATRQLRGRSFYLQLLTEAVAHAVLTEAALPLTNLIYSGGGRFYVLCAAHAGTALIPRLRRAVAERLLRFHGGALYFALGGAAFPSGEDGQAAWRAVSQAIDHDKRRRFAELDQTILAEALFSPRAAGVLPDVMDPAASRPQDALSASLEVLGRELHNKPFLLVRPLPAQNGGAALVLAPATWQRVLESFGLAIQPSDLDTLRSAPGRARLLAISDRSEAELDAARRSDPERTVGSRYTVNVAPVATREDVAEYFAGQLDHDGTQPLYEDAVKPFSLLAKQSAGIERLGVLRMDVDDLGDLFGRRLERADGLAGLAYTAALSGALSRFFEGWVGERCRRVNMDSGRGSVYAVYSGGDDLFIVGSWHLLPDLAADIRNEFVRYTTGQAPAPGAAPPVTISAGITLHGTKFPLYQAADEAAAALDRAKNFMRRGADARSKDALCFLGQTLGWEHYEETRAVHDQLVDLVRQHSAARGLLLTIQALHARYEAGRRQRRTRNGADQFEYGPWVWRGAYALTRVAEGFQAGSAARRQVEQLRDRITGEVEQRFIERAGLAARWAELSLRERTKEG